MKKFISFLLAVMMVVGSLTVCVIPTAASTNTGKIDYYKVLEDAYSHSYATPELYLEGQLAKGYMQLMANAHGYSLYCNPYSGEMAYKNNATGQVLTSNPYDFSTMAGMTAEIEVNPSADSTYTNLLSQVEIAFVDNTGEPRRFYSFVEAAARGQVVVKYMKNGFRVEYTMGRLNTSYLLPGVVTDDDFNDNILGVIDTAMGDIELEFGFGSEAYEQIMAAYMTISSWYSQSNYDTEMNIEFRDLMAKEYPDAYGPGKGTVWYLDENSDQGIFEKEKVYLENLLKTYCPDLDQDLLDAMHANTGYVQVNEESPVFRAAIEYVLCEDGLEVRLPASSIRFDETKYTLEYIKILQYFGAGNLENEGYVFYPDGSGAIVEFEEFYSKENAKDRIAVELSASVYGEDFAYYDIDTDSKHSEVIRVPVYGIVEKDEFMGSSTGRGFLAILEDGDALADIGVSFGAGLHNFATAFTQLYPRPSDAYNLSEAISVADNKEMTIVSDKKYTGFYKMKFIMLFDEDRLVKDAAEKADRYLASYTGMAKAYRDYLISKQILSPMTESDIKENELPIYFETLGSVETVKKILSIPVNVDVPLTSFDNLKAMYGQLSGKGIKNVNFKLTGYANGGLDAKYPKSLKWMSAIEGEDDFDFEALLVYAKENGIGIYPDFDFSYAKGQSGLSLRTHAARAVDDRYCSKQVYDPIYQEFASIFHICVTPASILEYIIEFDEEYKEEYDAIGISVSTLGSDLNSDFNKDNPVNRQEAKDYITQSLAHLKNTYSSVMADGGNIYSVEYLDHILNLSIDASNYKYESKAVPFMGMVLHGYVNYAGSAINEAGDGAYQVLKAIENGSLLYYMLIYQNSNLLKEDEELSKYYSVRFDIWFNTIVEQYNTLNKAIGDLQLYKIEDHNFIIGERIQLESEIIAEELDLNKQIREDLVKQATTLIEGKKNELRIYQITQNLIAGGLTDLDMLKSEVAYVFGVSELSEEQGGFVENALADPNLTGLYGKTVSVTLNVAALTEAIEAVTGKAITKEQLAIIAEISAQYAADADYVVEISALSDSVKKKDHTTDSYATDGKSYVKTEYTESSKRLVMVTYSDGTNDVHFVLNYNSYAVKVKLPGVSALDGGAVITVPAYGHCRIDGTQQKY